MNYRHAFLLIAATVAVSGCDQLQNANRTGTEAAPVETTSAPVVEGVVLASVNGTPLTQSMLDVYTTQRTAQNPNAEAFPLFNGFDPATIRAHARHFAVPRYHREMRGAVTEAMERGPIA